MEIWRLQNGSHFAKGEWIKTMTTDSTDTSINLQVQMVAILRHINISIVIGFAVRICFTYTFC